MLAETLSNEMVKASSSPAKTLVKAEVVSVGANESFIKDAAGKLVEVLVLEGVQQTGADFGGLRDLLETDTPLFALLLQSGTEGRH